MVAKKEQQGKKIQELYHKMASVQSVGSPSSSNHHFSKSQKERAYRIAIIFLDRIGRLSREPVTI